VNARATIDARAVRRKRNIVLESLNPSSAPADRNLRAKPLPLAPVRSQAAVVRMMVAELESAPADAEESMREQLTEELARLGCRLLETAAAVAQTDGMSPASPERGRN
jgi:hypothetical protein